MSVFVEATAEDKRIFFRMGVATILSRRLGYAFLPAQMTYVKVSIDELELTDHEIGVEKVGGLWVGAFQHRP